MRLFFTLSDFTGDGLASPLPHLAFSTSASSHEEAVPDVTFAHYHAAGALIPREHQPEHRDQPEHVDQHGRRNQTPEPPRLFSWEDLLRALDAPHARALDPRALVGAIRLVVRGQVKK